MNDHNDLQSKTNPRPQQTLKKTGAKAFEVETTIIIKACVLFNTYFVCR